MKVEQVTLYESNGLKWLVSTLKTGSDTIYQYYTIINGKGITISLNCAYSNTEKEELKDVIDTVKFSKLEEKAPDLTNYIIIGSTALLVIIVIVLMFMAFSKKKGEN